jgi:hypothetical protein
MAIAASKRARASKVFFLMGDRIRDIVGEPSERFLPVFTYS